MSRIFDALQRAGAEQSGIEYDDVMSMVTDVFEGPRNKVLSQAAAPDQIPAFSAPASQVPETAALAQDTEEDALPPEFHPVEVSPTASSRLVYFTEPNGLASEKFRFLGVRLRQLQQTRPLRKVLITSTIPQEGKSVVAANLACTLARREQKRTLLLDGDLRRPSLGRLFGLGKIAGISEWLQGEGGPATCIHQLKGTRLCILPAGNPPTNPLELMQSGKLLSVMHKLTTWFDWIVIDSPPVLPLADTSIWVRLADGVLLVARQGVTERKLLKRGLAGLERSKLLGTVLNASTRTVHSDYYYQAVAKS